MAFAGRWETESQEGYDDFCQLMGIPDNVIEQNRDFKAITEVTQDGDDFSWTIVYSTHASVTNMFTLGKECDMQNAAGQKFKATVNMEGDTLITTFPKYSSVVGISGDKLNETATCGSVVMKRTSKKI